MATPEQLDAFKRLFGYELRGRSPIDVKMERRIVRNEIENVRHIIAAAQRKGDEEKAIRYRAKLELMRAVALSCDRLLDGR